MSILKLMRDRQMYKYGQSVKKFDMQGGVRNYLGEQETVSDVPVKWQSGPDHPTTELAYITEAEKDLLLNQDLHNSLDGGPNRGPEGLMSLNGWGDTTSPGDFSGGSMDMGDSSYNANERTTTVDRNPDSPDSDPGQTTTVSSPQDTYGQKYTGGGFFNRVLGGANKYGYTDTYGGSGANRNDTKPGYFGRAVGGLGSLLTGIPFVGGALGTAYDYGKGIFGPKQKDMSQFNNLGLYEDERKQKAFNDNALYSDNYSDQKISDTSFSQKPDLNNLESIISSINSFNSDLAPQFQGLAENVGWNTKQKGLVESLQDLNFDPIDAYNKLSSNNNSTGMIFKDYPDALQPQEFLDKWYGGSFDKNEKQPTKYTVPGDVKTGIEKIYKDYA